MVQDGAYRRLLDYYYETGKPIPEDAEQIIRVCRAHSEEEIEAVSYVLKGFFRLKAGKWHNRFADDELSKMRRLSKLRSDSAKRRWDDKRNAKADANASTNAPANGMLPNTLLPNTTKESKPKAQSAFQLPDWIPQSNWQDFEEMRRKARKPMTDRARALVVAELFKLRNSGHDPAKVLDQSTRNAWQDVYELRGENGQREQRSQPKPNAVVARYHNNQSEKLRAFGAAVGEHPRDAGDRQAAGLGPGNPLVLEGEIKGV
jgi:uncharacterized protein YdaU (DUF1376 family)